MSSHSALRLQSLLLIAGAAGTLAAGAALPSPRTTWRTLQSPNFQLVGDVSAKTLSEAAERLELFRAALARVTARAAERPPLPTVVLLFSSDRAFRPYALSDRPADQLAGAFHPTAWGNYMVINASGGDDALDVVYSGYVQQVIAYSYPSTPFWLNAGLSEFYRTFRVTSSGIDIGRPARQHLEVLRGSRRIPLTRLMAIDARSPEYLDSSRSDVFFAESWVLVHYLLVGEPSLAPRVPDLIARLGRGESAEVAITGALGFGVDELERRLLSYIGRSIFKYTTWARGDLTAPPLPAVSELPRAPTLELLAEYLAHAGDLAAAKEHLDEAVRLGGETGDTLALAGFLAEKSGRFDEAGGLYARSLESPQQRVCSPAHVARFELDHLEDGAGGQNGVSARLDLAKRAVESALALDPDYGEAWAIKGYVALRAGDPTSALVALSEAERRLPQRPDIAYNRFVAALDAGQLGIARGIAAGPLARLDPESSRQALRDLDQKQDYELVTKANEESMRALNEGRYAEAAAPLRAALEKVRDPQLHSQLEERVSAVEKDATRGRRIDAYNHAAELANARKYREAREVAAALVAECTDDPVCDSARKLLDWLDRRLGTKH
jgi:tetratricopeptide (TPR) repeat protein